jgi:phosphohistidine phosphatase
MYGMRTLYLLRHAKSSWGDPDVDDRDRPLNERGRRAASQLAEHLRLSGCRPELVVCSPALRTRQTLDLVAIGLGVQARVRVDESVYGATAAALWRLVRDLPDSAGEVLVVGHNPGLHELAASLADSGDTDDDATRERLRAKLPTCSLVTLAWPGDTWVGLRKSATVLHNFVTPRDLN